MNRFQNALVIGPVFAYDGDGRRLLMSVAGEVTTYTLDYGGGNRVLFEDGVNFQAIMVLPQFV